MNTQWKVNGSTDTTAIWVEDAEGKRVCTVRNCETDLDRARLIAAAPDLLEALRECVAQLRASSIAWAGPIDRAEAAIAKATER